MRTFFTTLLALILCAINSSYVLARYAGLAEPQTLSGQHIGTTFMINIDYDVSMNIDVHPETVFVPSGIIQCVPGTWENDKRYVLPCELLHTNISTEMTLEVTGGKDVEGAIPDEIIFSNILRVDTSNPHIYGKFLLPSDNHQVQPGESVVYAFSANELVHISSVAFIINQERKITDCVISDLVQSDEGDWSGMVTCLVPADAPEGPVTLFMNFTDDSGNVGTDAVTVAEEISVAHSTIIPTTLLSVTIDQAVGQIDPTSNPTIIFMAEFSESVQSGTVDCTDISVTNGSCTSVVDVSSTMYTVNVTGATSGVVTASVIAGGVLNTVGNTNLASTSVDNRVLFNYIAPATGGGVILPQFYNQITPTSIHNQSLPSTSTGSTQGSTLSYTNQDSDRFVGLNYPQPTPTNPTSPTLPRPSTETGGVVSDVSTGSSSNTGTNNPRYNPTNTTNTGSSGGFPSSKTNNGMTVSTDLNTSSNTNTSATGTPEIDDATQTSVPTTEETTADEGQQIFSTTDGTIDIGGGQPAREVRGGNALIWTLVGLIVTLNLWWFFVARIKKKSQGKDK